MAEQSAGFLLLHLFFYEEVHCESDKYKSKDFLKMCSRHMFNQSCSKLCANDPPYAKEETDFIVDICELIVCNRGYRFEVDCRNCDRQRRLPWQIIVYGNKG